MTIAPPAVVDTHMQEIPAATAAFVVTGRQIALVDCGTAASLPATEAALAAAGVDSLDWIVLTHVHLDHAGAAGALARRHPRAKIAVHERAARHLVDPARLIAGVRAVYGEASDRLWGVPEPVPAERVVTLTDGDEIDLGGRVLRAVATPGHTRTHLAFLDEESGVACVGDALGIWLPGSDATRPASPPADFSLADAIASIERLRALDTTALWPAHFGAATTDPAAMCDRAIEALRCWHALVDLERRRPTGTGDLAERVGAAIARRQGRSGRDAQRRLELVNPVWLNVAGIVGDLDRQAEAGAAPERATAVADASTASPSSTTP